VAIRPAPPVSIMLAFRRECETKYLFLAVALLCLALAGCDKGKSSSAEDEAIAQHYIKLLRQNNFGQIEKDLDPKIKSPDIREVLTKMANMIPATNATSVKIVGWNVLHLPDSRSADITFEYEFSRKWLLIYVANQKMNGVLSVTGFGVTPIKDSLKNINRFALTGKSPVHYTVLVLMVIIPIFMLLTLVQCIRTKPIKRKWLWIIFILLGVGKFSVNWTTGQYSIFFLTIQLLGAGYFSPGYGYAPWFLSVSLPLGAILFLIMRKKLRARELTNGCTGSEQNAAPPPMSLDVHSE
jgi:hypothetical protein